MKPPHVVIVSQNATLESTCGRGGRPRPWPPPGTRSRWSAAVARRRTSARSPHRTSRSSSSRNRPMVRAWWARCASRARRWRGPCWLCAGRHPAAGGGGARGQPARQLLLRRPCAAAVTGLHPAVRLRPARRGARPSGREVSRDGVRAAADGHGAEDRAAELLDRRPRRVRQRRIPLSGRARGTAAERLRGGDERMVVAGRVTRSTLAGGRGAPAGYIGTISEQDNVDRLVEAVAVLAPRGRSGSSSPAPDLHLRPSNGWPATVASKGASNGSGS